MLGKTLLRIRSGKRSSSAPNLGEATPSYLHEAPLPREATPPHLHAADVPHAASFLPYLLPAFPVPYRTALLGTNR